MTQTQITVDFGSVHSVSKVQNDWTHMAKEAVKVEYIGGAYFGFCSELAAYRLVAAYGYLAASKGKVAARKGPRGWYFMLEVG